MCDWLLTYIMCICLFVWCCNWHNGPSDLQRAKQNDIETCIERESAWYQEKDLKVPIALNLNGIQFWLCKGHIHQHLFISIVTVTKSTWTIILFMKQERIIPQFHSFYLYASFLGQQGEGIHKTALDITEDETPVEQQLNRRCDFCSVHVLQY